MGTGASKVKAPPDNLSLLPIQVIAGGAGLMSYPKRHHFIPQMLQRRFADGTGRLYSFDQRRPEDGVRPEFPINLFVEKHLYSIKEKSGDKNPGLEERLSRLEGPANGVITRIEEAADKGRGPKLSEDERSIWDLFFYVQWKRTPDNFERTNSLSDFDETLRKSVEDFEQRYRPLTDAEREELKDPAVLSRLKHNAKVGAVGAGSDEVLQALHDKGLAILRIEALNKSFILGSNPIAKLTSRGHTHISDPTVEIWFPISPKLAVSPAYLRGEERLIPMKDAKDVRYINMAIAKQSTVIAGNNEDLISSLIHPR